MSSVRARAAAAIAVATLLAGCGQGVASSRPSTAGGSDVATTRAELARALGALSLQLDDPQVPYRPAEGTAFASAPRAVYQVVLPDDPGHGFISVYQFPDERVATAAATDQAAYVASGPGRVQFPPDTRFVLRQLGPTVVFYHWSPANSPDPRTPDIEKALDALGTPIPVPN